MPIYKPSELKAYLTSLGISPRKQLSQNFLLDRNIINKIITLADVKANDLILEIGPGPGALTEALLEKQAKVIAVEKDEVLAKGLKRLQKESNNLEIHCADILDFPLENFSKKAKIIANLPYNLTTPIMTRFISRLNLFSEMIVMVQEEVARRFTAEPGTKDYGSLTLFLKFYSDPFYGFKVSRNCFYPRPNVDSAMVKFNLKKPPSGIDQELFFHLTRTAFGQRRKMLTSTLGKLYPPEVIIEALQELTKSPKSRPEELSLEDFIHLYHRICAL